MLPTRDVLSTCLERSASHDEEWPCMTLRIHESYILKLPLTVNPYTACEVLDEVSRWLRFFPHVAINITRIYTRFLSR